nr:MAG TPA: hypothetical protein [Caudoviricetes sp.]
MEGDFSTGKLRIIHCILFLQIFPGGRQNMAPFDGPFRGRKFPWGTRSLYKMDSPCKIKIIVPGPWSLVPGPCPVSL